MLLSIVMPMLLGFAIFLAGMKLMELALHRFAGPHLARVLRRSTSTPIHGLVVGTAASAVLQSSTAVTVITIGLVNARLLTFSRTLGIVLGTNVGTCLTTELIGLNLSRWSMPLTLMSLALWLLTALLGEMRLIPAAYSMPWLAPLRSLSLVLCGFGLLLFGIAMMQSIGPAVQSSSMFSWFVNRADDSLLWGVAAGTVMTAIVHSSAAVIAMMMGLATIGAIPPELGIAVILGSNIGTCFTALLASLGGSKPGQFVAWSHIALNAGGAILFLPLIGELTAVSDWISATPSSMLAHAQTLFNVACSLIALPLCYLPIMQRLDQREG
ncbi:Na/Pi cotransporter family protein [Paenibacillus sp. GCM10023252]|uniref:Na/Pi cotransporter family protein n=1 Tax=Paenibacillus sp. GCM10023252 TaxID=3252649 RepID=UPI00361EB883